MARKSPTPGAKYVPDRGHLIWLQFDPQAGREQSGHRPALVLSPKQYNSKTNLAVVVPITSAVKGYPFEVRLPESGKIAGAVLADQVRSLDFVAREAKLIAPVPASVLAEVLAKLSALVGLTD